MHNSREHRCSLSALALGLSSMVEQNSPMQPPNGRMLKNGRKHLAMCALLYPIIDPLRGDNALMQLRIRDLKVQYRVRLLQTIVTSGVSNTKGCARLK